jgi:transposase
MSEAKRRKQRQKNATQLPILNPAAAGIDIGATEIYVAVRPDRDPEPVRSFSTFTEDLHRVADWLKA